jgi:hypothetical protein
MVNAWYARHADEVVETQYPQGWNIFPWIDSLPDDWPGRYEVIHYYLKQAVAAGYPRSEGPLYSAYSEATRLWLRDLIAARQPVGRLLEILAEGHRAWCRRMGRPVPP